MKQKRLSYKRKLYFAWQFLRRSPAYRDHYAEYNNFHCECKMRNLQSILPRSERNQVHRQRLEIEREYLFNFLNFFSIKMPPIDPNIENPKSAELSRLFSRVKCVEENIFAPDPRDKRFQITVNPFYPNCDIQMNVMNQVRQLRQVAGIQPRYYQPSEMELSLYLRVYDQYQTYVKAGEFTPWDENNFGLSLYWSKFSRALSFQEFDIDPETLRRSTFKAAIKGIHDAPLSILP